MVGELRGQGAREPILVGDKFGEARVEEGGRAGLAAVASIREELRRQGATQLVGRQVDITDLGQLAELAWYEAAERVVLDIYGEEDLLERSDLRREVAAERIVLNDDLRGRGEQAQLGRQRSAQRVPPQFNGVQIREAREGVRDRPRDPGYRNGGLLRLGASSVGIVPLSGM